MKISSTISKAKKCGLLALTCLIAPLAGCKKKESLPASPAEIEAQIIQKHLTLPPAHVYGGLPIVSNRSVIVITNIGYVSGYDKDRHDPDYVFYRLTPIGNVGFHAAIEERPGRFTRGTHSEIDLPENPLSDTGYDHGHLAPNYAIASRYGRQAQLETFTVWNILPELPSHNRRTWKQLERYEADTVANKYTIWVCDGPVFSEKHPIAQKHTGQSTHIEIPKMFYKIWITESEGNIKVIGFLIPQEAKPTKNFEQFIVTVRAIESLTSINFFPEMPEVVQEKIERELPQHIW